MLRDLLKMIFEQVFGAKVLQASSNEQALRTAKRHNPNLVISDYMRARGNGLEFLRVFKSRYPQTPVVMLTGHAVSIRQRARRIGASACLAKPIKLHRLIALKRLLNP